METLIWGPTAAIARPGAAPIPETEEKGVFVQAGIYGSIGFQGCSMRAADLQCPDKTQAVGSKHGELFRRKPFRN